MKTARDLVETFQCPGCIHGDNTRCGKFKLHELTIQQAAKGEQFPAPMRCQNHEVPVSHMGVRLNFGLPPSFARVQYREGAAEEVKTNIRIHVAPPPAGVRLWDGFNVPVWAMELRGFLFVRTYNPRTDQSYVDVIQGGTFELLDGTNCIDIGPIADSIPL